MSDEPAAWSYATEMFSSGDLDDVGPRLNALGADGWELVTSAAYKSLVANMLVFTLKKPGAGHVPPARPADLAY